jgi:hypothetical protein
MDVHRQSDKLDLYSVPVFVLELIILVGLAFAAHHIHFQYKHEPYLTGFYCDDISIRHDFRESKLVEQFARPDNELVVLSLLLAVPIVVVSKTSVCLCVIQAKLHLVRTTKAIRSRRYMSANLATTIDIQPNPTLLSIRLSSANWSTRCSARSSSAEFGHYAGAANSTP